MKGLLNRFALGCRGERKAVRYLKTKGYVILATNLRTPYGEVDIVARDGESLVFVEVKTRNSDSYGEPFESVDGKKQKRLKRIAMYYLKQQRLEEMPVRFDVISIRMDKKEKILHIQGAF